MERTLCILKPDVVREHAVGTILTRITDYGFEILDLKMCALTRESVELLYAEHVGKPWFEEHAKFMCSGSIVVVVLACEDAVSRWREAMGATKPSEASYDSIRSIYGRGLPENAVHGSDSVESAEREIEFFFPSEAK